MRLKSLEIKGFKSFADKTVVNFDDNITGIVGPNGCGKSNIVDSIRWVIGEQKISHLRSENLDSLVFNGSKTRSASGLAEVSLTFENTKNLLPTPTMEEIGSFLNGTLNLSKSGRIPDIAYGASWNLLPRIPSMNTTDEEQGSEHRYLNYSDSNLKIKKEAWKYQKPIEP